MRPEQPRGETREIPTFTVGQRVEAKIENIEEDTGNYGKQFRFDMVLESGYPVKAWIKHYAVPQPNQHLGKLCIAIERVNKQTYRSVNDAITAIKNYGRIFLEAKNPKSVTGDDGITRVYPRFGVWPEMLPGELNPQPYNEMAQAIRALPQVLPTTLPQSLPATQGQLSPQTIDWLIAHQDIIGKKILPEVYNDAYPEGIITELHELGDIKMIDDYPWLSETARRHL